MQINIQNVLTRNKNVIQQIFFFFFSSNALLLLLLFNIKCFITFYNGTVCILVVFKFITEFGIEGDC